MTFFTKKTIPFCVRSKNQNLRFRLNSFEDSKYRLLAHQQNEQTQKFFEMHAETQTISAQRAANTHKRLVEIEKKLGESVQKQSETEKELDTLSFSFAITCLTCATLFVANVLKAIEK